MEQIPAGEVERTMKVQEVMLRAMARAITWFQAAEILGMSDRHLRRYREQYERAGAAVMREHATCGRGPSSHPTRGRTPQTRRMRRAPLFWAGALI